MRARLLVASGLASVLATGSTALAAPPWSPPRDIGAAARDVSRATLAFARDGTAVVSRRISPDAVRRETDRDRLATIAPDGTLAEHPLPGLLAAPPEVFGRGRVAMLRETVLLSDPDTFARRVRLSLSVGSLRAPVSRRSRRLATYTPVPSDGNTGPAMEVGPRGEIAVVWMEYRGDEFAFGRFRVRLAIRRPDGRFERTRTVAAGGVEGNRESHSVAVAFGARRDVIVAYALDPPRSARRRIAVRTLRRGRRFGPPQILGRHSGLVDLQLRATRTGRAIAAWSTQDGGEEANSPSIVRAAIQAPGAARFGVTRVMDPGETNERVPGRLALAMAPDGSAVLAWSNVRGRGSTASFPARLAIAEAGAGFGPVSELAPSGAVADAAARADGALLLTWTDVRDFTGEGDRATHAALRAASGQPFGAPELVDASSPGIGRGLAAAFDPRTRRPSAAWTIPPSPGPDSAVLRLATRTG
jgi:hypothetical protein